MRKVNEGLSSAQSRIARKRRLLMSGGAMLLLATGSAANADVFVTTEGQPTVQGDIDLTPQFDEFYVSAFRVGADGSLNLGAIGDYSALATGTVNTNGGGDFLWLTVSGDQTLNLLAPPPGSKVAEFGGGVGYYINDDGANLVIKPSAPGATYDRTLELGGEGAGSVTVDAFVQKAGLALLIDNTNLDVTVRSTIDTIRPNFAPLADENFSPVAVDARNSNSFTLAKGASIRVLQGLALKASSELTVIEDGAEIRAKDSTNGFQNATLVSAAGDSTVVNRGLIREEGNSGVVGNETEDTISVGVYLSGRAVLRNERTSATRAGTIAMHGDAVQFAGGQSSIINDGLIQSDMRSAIKSTDGGFGDRLTIRNNAEGTIQGLVNDARDEFDHYTTAIEGYFGAEAVINAGTINGDVLLSGGQDIFLAVADANGNPVGTVNGVVDGGAGDNDVYGRSFNINGTYTASNATLTADDQIVGFERHGVEALGADTVATFAADEVLTSGLSIFGDGTVVNQADIEMSGSQAAIEANYHSGLIDGVRFINDTGASVKAGTGNAFYAYGNLGGFTNRGLISSGIDDTVYIVGWGIPSGTTFGFNNSGDITHGGVFDAVWLSVDGTTDAGADIDFQNSGTISGGRGAVVRNDEGAINVVNSGAINGASGDALFLVGEAVSVQNDGTIRADGANVAALKSWSQNSTITNSGTIEVGGTAAERANAAVIIQDGNGTLVNEATGVIEGGTNSVAVAVDAQGGDFTLTNRGRIASADAEVARSENGDIGGSVVVAGHATWAGAIQTVSSADTVVNAGSGTIVGNVDLNDRDDRFEARDTSSLQGDLRLGTGNDTLLLAGGTISGVAYGGDGDDTLLIDLSQDRSIVGEKFSSFETIRRDGSGTGILTASGTFDIDTLNLDGMTVRVAADTTLATQGATTITGSDNDERLIVAGTIAGSVNLGGGNDYLDLSSGGTVNGTIDGGDGNDTIGFRIIADSGTDAIPDVINFESLDVSGGYTLTLDRAFDTVSLRDGADLIVTADAGTINNIYGDDTSQSVTVLGQLTGGVNLGGGDDMLTLANVSGFISGAMDGGEGQDILHLNLVGATEFGDGARGFETIMVTGAAPLTINGAFDAGQALTFGDDDNELVIGAGGVFAGSADGGAGNDRLTVTTNAPDTRTVLAGQLQNFETLNSNGTGTLALTSGAFGFDSVAINGGNLALGADTALTAGGGVTFAAGADNRLTLAAGATISGMIDAGDGDDTLALEQGQGQVRALSSVTGFETFENLESSGAGELSIDRNATFASVMLNGGLTSILQGVTLTGPVTGSAAAERIAVNGSLAGTLDLGGGDNMLMVAAGGEVTGGVQMAGGADTVTVNGMIGGNLDLGDGANMLAVGAGAQVTGNVLLGGGADSVTVNGMIGGNLDLGDGANMLAVGTGAQVTGNVLLGGGADTVMVNGAIGGSLNLGDGDDRLVVSTTGMISGGTSGGAGVDTLAWGTTGTYEMPTILENAGYAGFERLELTGGVVSVTADSNWIDFDVLGGRLIGQAGTTITSTETINVAAGATFGSAGTVIANINVLGTLSPGASPGTMTVNGDVTMAAGSNLLIEVTPNAGTDLLDVNGTLTIASGAAIDITGAISNLPGSVLDLVVADTITGRFTTVNKSSTVFGFVVQNGNRIQLRSEFANSDAYPSNVRASVAYANQVLRDGYGVQAFTSALNVLTDAEGTIDQRAFAQLTPEAYGTAIQIGVENALQIADVSRTLRMTTPVRDGLYGFAQGLIGGTDIEGQAATGASRASLDTTGFFGGIGYGMGGFQIGVFLGKIDTDQRLSQLDAETRSNGWTAGAYADAMAGGFGLHGMIAYSDADATTTRTLAAAPTQAKGEYGIKSWVADMSVDYAFDMNGVSVMPKAGVTYVNADRATVRESGAGDFALTVDKSSDTAWFADAGVAVSGTVPVLGLGVSPYAEIGLRHRLNDSDVAVAGGFSGAPSAPIVVAGAERDRTVARFGIGFGLDLNERVRFHAGYTGEFSNTDRASYSAGASIRF